MRVEPDMRRKNQRPPLLNKDKVAELKSILEAQSLQERWGMSEVRQWIYQQTGKLVQYETVNRYIALAGFSSVRTHKAPNVSEVLPLTPDDSTTKKRRNKRRKLSKEQTYPSDLTDAEWEKIEPYLVGKPRKASLRQIMNAILYILRTGAPWRYLPKDYPHVETVKKYFYCWRDVGIFEKMNEHLTMEERERAGRQKTPTIAIIDSQSVKTGEKGGSVVMMEGKK